MRLCIPEICIYTCWFLLRGMAFLASVNAQEPHGNDAYEQVSKRVQKRVSCLATCYQDLLFRLQVVEVKWKDCFGSV